MRLLEKPPTADPSFDPQSPNPSTSWAPPRVQYRQFQPTR